MPLDSLVQSGTDSSGDPLFRTTREILQEKHSCGRAANPDSLLNSSLESSCFDQLDGCVIKRAAFHTHGAAGQSGVDAFGWQHLCSSLILVMPLSVYVIL